MTLNFTNTLPSAVRNCPQYRVSKLNVCLFAFRDSFYDCHATFEKHVLSEIIDFTILQFHAFFLKYVKKKGLQSLFLGFAKSDKNFHFDFEQMN